MYFLEPNRLVKENSGFLIYAVCMIYFVFRRSLKLTVDMVMNGYLSYTLNATPTNNRGHPSGRLACLISTSVKCTVTLLSPLCNLASALKFLGNGLPFGM